MNKSIRDIDGRIILYPCLIFFTILLIVFDNLECFIIINIALITLICFLTRVDIRNPILLLTTVFILYQIAYPILNSLNVRVFEYCSLNSYYYLYNWIATASFLVFYGSISNVSYPNGNLRMKLNDRFLRLFYFVLSIICVIASVYIIKNGFQTKYDLANSTDAILSLGNMAYTALLILPVFFLFSQGISRKEKNIIVITTFALMLFGMFTYGERSYVFNYLLILLICYSVLRKLTIRKIVVFVLGVVILFSFSSSLKMLFASEAYIGVNNDENNLVISFLNSDFASAGFNFNYLLNNDDSGVLGGKTYVYDLLSPLDGLFDLKNYSATNWYTNQYWSERRTGLGFTIIGEGYVNFGVIGIVFQMLILSRLVKFFYLRSNKNGFHFVIFVGVIALSMYSCRQALGNIISPLVKYYILTALLMYYTGKLFLREGKVSK